MKYMGSKARIAKEILPLILKNRVQNQWYVEPFAGGMNSIQHVSGNRIASDNNEYLIEMWKGLIQDLDRPRIITREYYTKVRDSYNKKDGLFSKFIIGWVGFMGSYNGRFFDGGYSGHCVGRTKRDYITEQIRNTERQVDSLTGVDFIKGSYSEIDIPKNSLVYCDPPYEGTKQYSTSRGFDHDHFWNWVRETAANGHTVFVSEYNAPEDFVCIWEKNILNTMNQTKTYRPIEKLFTLNQ